MKRVRKGKAVGPDYDGELYRNPFAAGLDHESGDTTTKTLDSPSATPTGVGIPLYHNYDKNWEGK